MTIGSLALLLILFQAPVNPAPATASVEGVVLRSGSGEPLARAQVKLLRARTPEQERELYQDGEYVDPAENAPKVMTEADGKFLFKDIPPGPYRITAARNGYAEQTFGQKVPDGPSTVINLDPAQSLKNITFRLIQAGVITGRVRDAAGEPVPGAEISLMGTNYDETGRKNLWPRDSVTSDDRGEYRLYWIPPGRYYLRAAPSSQVGFSYRTIVADRTISPAFYPGTPDPENASVVGILPGTELGGLDIVLPRSLGYRIGGRLVDGTTGKPPKNASVRVVQRKPSAITVQSFQEPQSKYDSATGAFEVPNVLPGAYWLIATSRSDSQNLSPEALTDVRTRNDTRRRAGRYRFRNLRRRPSI